MAAVGDPPVESLLRRVTHNLGATTQELNSARKPAAFFVSSSQCTRQILAALQEDADSCHTAARSLASV